MAVISKLITSGRSPHAARAQRLTVRRFANASHFICKTARYQARLALNVRLPQNAMIEFEWDPEKEDINIRKHGIDFEEAMSAFSDPLSLTIPDPDHSEGEFRYLLLGTSQKGRLIVVSHTERDARIRIINSRLADRREKRDYEQ